MNASDIGEWLMDALPIKRKSAADWMVPAFIGLGVGVAAGVGVGILVAPDSGYMTRLRLRESASRVKDRAAELADRAKSQISTTTSEESPEYAGEVR